MAGSGGEYNVQEGFGWTNAVVLSLINRYNSTLTGSSLIYLFLKKNITNSLTSLSSYK